MPEMNLFDYNAIKCWATTNDIFIKLSDGREASLPIARFPLLAKATKEQLEKVEIIDGYALHWPDLDEDLSVAGFFDQPVLETNTALQNTVTA